MTYGIVAQSFQDEFGAFNDLDPMLFASFEEAQAFAEEANARRNQFTRWGQMAAAWWFGLPVEERQRLAAPLAENKDLYYKYIYEMNDVFRQIDAHLEYSAYATPAIISTHTPQPL